MTSVVTSTELREQLQAAIETLRHGGVVAFPTDTLYGLGADYASPSAVQRVINIKGRSSAAGLPLLLSGVGQLPLVTGDIPKPVWPLVERFWPGPLTLIVSMVFSLPDKIRSTVQPKGC